MNTATTVLSLLLLLYFLWRSLRQRVFLLGLPVLMDMYYSIFFDRIRPFWLPQQWAPADHMMFWLLATWVVYFDLVLPKRRRSVQERHLFGPSLSWPEEMALVGLAAYSLFKVATTAVGYMDLSTAISEARIPLYIFVGYFLLRGILCHAGRRETMDFLAAVVVVNTIAAAFYLMHQGLHLYIYSGLFEHTYIVVNGEVLTRSFYFMPQYLPLAIAYCVAKRKTSLFWLGVLVVSLAAIWVSYTRALILVAIAEIVVVLGVRLLKQRDNWPALKRAVQVLLMLGMLVVVAMAVMPTESEYLMSRVAETQSRGSVLEDNNLQWRLQWWRTTADWVGGNSLLGMGYPSAGQDARVARIDQMAADSVWVPALWSLGMLGVAGLAGLFIAFGWRALKMSMASQGDAAFLSTVLFGVTVGVFLLGFVEWTVLDPWHTPLALSFLALISAERRRQRDEIVEPATNVLAGSEREGPETRVLTRIG